MDAEVIAWTLVFFGGDLLVVLALIAFAIKKDREKARTERGTGRQAG